MSLWDDLPAAVRNTGALDPLQSALSAIDTTGLPPREVTDVDGTWTERAVAVDVPALAGLQVDPATGRWGGAGSSTPIEFVDTQVTVAYGRHLTGPGGAEDGGWRLDLDVPGIRLLVPYLRGAKLDQRGQLVLDPANPQVRFILPRIVIRTMQPAGATVATRLRSASTSGDPVDDIYSFVRMTPSYALIGPGDTVGFAFRTAELDLSALADPPGLPPGARAVAAEWQGLHLPEVRLFVSPDGLDGLAVSAGVRDLWIGIGEQDGVTGAFSAEVVDRGGAPTVTARFVTPAGRHVEAVAGGAVEVPDQSVFLVDATGGLAPHTTGIEVVGGPSVAGDRLTVTVPAAGTVELRVTVTDADGHSHGPVSFRALRPAAGEGSAPALANPAGLRLLTPERGQMVIVTETAAEVTVRLEPEAPADWSWPGGASPGATSATVPLAADSTVVVSATTTQPADARTMALDCYFRFEHPKPSETTDSWWRNPANTGARPAPGRTATPAGQTFTDLARDRRTDIGATPLVVDGYASFEGDDSHTKRTYNQALSRRRLEAAVAILTDLGYSATAGSAHGHADARDRTSPDPGVAAPPASSGEWWLARARKDDAPVQQQVDAELHRGPAAAPPAQRDPQPPTTGWPDCFRRLGVEVELIRTTFVRLEVWGEFDVQTAIEASLDEGGEPPLGGRGPNPGDGLCAFRVRLRLATDRESWEVFGEFRALEADLNGLWEGRDTDTGINTSVLNVLGALAVTGPLAAGAAELSPAAGTLVQLGSVALGASNLVRTQVLTMRGGEVVISDGIIAPDGSTTGARGTQVSVLLDVEVQFWFDLTIIRVPEDRPIRTRYKAVGVRSGWGAGAKVDYVPIPVFDPRRGYELDIQPGSLVAASPLDEILRVFGVRVSRDNPTYLEVEAGIDVPLGPVTVDTVRVRARLDGPFDLQLAKLGARLDVPNTIHGSGSIELTGAGFKAAFDLTIVPLSVRAAATLAIETKDGVTGLLIGIEVEFPAPLPLGNSGLAIYGLLGGVGINYARLEDATARVPALDWLMKQLGPMRNSVMHPDGWGHTAGAYAFAAGLLLGTTEGGFVLHLKGIILIEVPGPRLLLVMKADVLKLPPALGSTQSATFLAVLDIDFGAGTITLGIVADYTIEKILKIHVPVTAFFDSRHPEEWLVELGSYDDRVTVEVLNVFRATGYLMVHGDGISIPPLPATTGLSIATGFHIQAVLMGSKPARLYVEAAAGFDAVLGFDPFFLAGTVYLRGELRLFIVSIGVSAELTLMVGKRRQGGVLRDDPYVHGKVCGRVEFFFFTVKGCVSLTIGNEPDPDLLPRELVVGVALAGRTPALVEGSGGRTSDAVVGQAAEVVGGVAQGEVPVVPLDAVPVVGFHIAPDAEGLTVMGEDPKGSSGAAGAGAWRRIGQRWWAYRVTGVTMTGTLGAGRTPSAWWTPSAPGSSTAEPPSLSLLNWLPSPFTSTVTYGQTLRTQLEHRWGTVCRPAAPPQEQMWTFLAEPLGPEPDGWLLDPVPWPDPDGLLRTTPGGRQLRVTEPWRTGDPIADRLQGTTPAEVVGDAIGCPVDDTSREDPFATWSKGNGTLDPTSWAGPRSASYAELAELLAAGSTINDVTAHWLARTPDPQAARLKDCEGRILAAPLHSRAEPAPFGARADRELVDQARAKAGWTPDPLADAVAMSLEDDLARFTVLLLVPRERSRPLLAEVRSATGEVLDRREIDHDAFVGPSNPLPDRWVLPDGPWAGPVELAGRAAAKISAGERDRPRPVLVSWDDLPEGATTVAVGWAEEGGQHAWTQRFWVIAASALTRAEVLRHDYDQMVVNRDREALSTGLTEDPTDHALLVPGQTYDVMVTWTYDSETGDSTPTRTPTFGNEQTQVFRFTAEGLDRVPADLGPWLLDTSPGMGDAGVFCHEPLRVTLATQNVLRLFDAYKHRLEVTVLSASGKHPSPPGGGAAGAPLMLPLFADGAADSPLQLKPNAIVLSPWDHAAGQLAEGQPCVEAGSVTRDVEELVLAYDLEPLTDYILDIHAVPTGPGTPTRVHRANFTTSRFDDLDHLASWVALAPVDHRVVLAPGPLGALPTRPTGDEWDKAVQEAGLPVEGVPAVPAVQVWWSADPVPQPIAVVVESSEQLVRERVMPVQVTGPVDATDPSHVWWAARPGTWLDVRPAAAPPDPATAATVTGGPVIGPGGTRVMVRLAAGQRGKRLTLELVQASEPLATEPGRSVTIVDLTLTGAPWEVEF